MQIIRPQVPGRRSHRMKPQNHLPHLSHAAPHRPHPPKTRSHHDHEPPLTIPPQTAKTRFAKFIGRNWARVGYAYRVEPTWLEINRHTIPVRDLGSGFHGVKIAHLTDFHCGPQVPT